MRDISQQVREYGRFGVAALLLPLLAALGACRSSTSAPSPPVLRIGFGIGATAKPSGVAALAEILYSEPLVTREVDGRPSPHLAERWVWENSDRRVRVRLRKGVKLHSGAELTPDLVARSLQAQVAEAREASGQSFDTVQHIAVDGGDLVVDLSRPDALLLSELLGLRISDPDAPDNGTGPFRIVSRTPELQTARFDEYHGGVPAIAGVRIVTYDSQRSAWAALLRGEVDAVQEINRGSVEFLEGSSTARTFTFLQPFYIPLVFNLRHHALMHVEVRRAITEALDRYAIVARSMHGHGRVADGPIWPLHWAYSGSHPRYAYDPARAAGRLERAGFPVRRSTSPAQPDSRLTFRCLFWSEDPQYERIALMVQRQLFEIGIHVELEPATLLDLRTRVSSGDFDAFLMRTNASRSLDLTYRFWRSTPPGDAAMQRSGYSGADDLLDLFQRSTSDQDVRRAVEALSRRFYEDAPAAFIAWTEITRAVNSSFEVPDVGAEDPFAKISHWRPVRETRR